MRRRPVLLIRGPPQVGRDGIDHDLKGSGNVDGEEPPADLDQWSAGALGIGEFEDVQAAAFVGIRLCKIDFMFWNPDIRGFWNSECSGGNRADT
jgi:hypothetical protein